MDTLQKYVAELLGTFVLVFGGTTALVASLGTGLGLVSVAFAFGLALLAGLYAFGEVSGGHYNPAVSLAMFLDGRLSSADLVRYWATQFAGAILASLVLLIATSKLAVKETATVPGPDGAGTAFLMEIVFTAIFVAVILQASASGRFGATALLAIPLTLVAVHLAAIPFSGSSVKPARSLGPALVGNRWTDFWIYLTAPLIGAVIAVAIHKYLKEPAEGAPAATAEVPERGPPREVAGAHLQDLARMRTPVALVVLAGALMLAGAACGGDDDDAAGSPSLEGTAWSVTSGVEFPEDAVPTLTLEDGNASGFGGCNQFSGGYEVDGDSISLGPLASTMMACPDDQMATEGAYLPALEAADSWAIEGGELVLSKGGEESLRFSAGSE